MASHIARPIFATNANGAKVWTATPALAGVLGRSGRKQSTGLFPVPPHPFGGVHTSTGALPTARFPGQWFKSESGLHQNWMRNYDPTTGRYLQADPLGLVDGASVYGYVKQSPMRFTDPTGQFIPAVLACLTNVACASTVIATGYLIYDLLCADTRDEYVAAIINFALSVGNPCKGVLKYICAAPFRGGKGGSGGGAAGGGEEPPIFGSDIDTAIEGAQPGPNTRGPSDVWEKSGGYESALEDFHNMADPSSVAPLAPGKDGYKGKTADGSNISVRPVSKDSGPPTVQIENGDGTRVKIRY